jgi:hypothetical protein
MEPADQCYSQGNRAFQYGRGVELWNSDRDRAIETIVTDDVRSEEEVPKSLPPPEDLAKLHGKVFQVQCFRM